VGLLQSGQALLASALELGRTRLELVSVEMQELLARLVLIMIGAVAAILLAALALGFGAVALVLAVPDQYRLAVTGGLALVFLVAAIILGRRAAREAKSRPFMASLAELQRDLDELKPGP
jgi:uncharacterized membrane protein YqjE